METDLRNPQRVTTTPESSFSVHIDLVFYFRCVSDIPPLGASVSVNVSPLSRCRRRRRC